jgi:hypothetical protein
MIIGGYRCVSYYDIINNIRHKLETTQNLTQVVSFRKKNMNTKFVLDVLYHFYPLPSFFFLHVLPKRHRLGVYFGDLSVFLIIIVLT